MRKYSILHIPVMSFFSQDLYCDVGLNWRRTCLGYLFVLLALCWIPSMVKVHLGLSEFIETEAPKFVSQVPTITIKDGLASVDEPQPYYIVDPDTNDVLIIIDTTGTITSIDDSNALGLITSTEAIYKEDELQTRTFNFAEIEDFTLTQAKINRWLNTLRTLAVPVMYPAVLAGSYVFRIIQALIFAAVGMLFAYWCKTQVGYMAMLRLAVVALTPAIIFKTVINIAGAAFCGVGLLYIGMTLAYLFVGVKAVAEALQPTDDVEIGPPPTQFQDQI